MRATAGTMTSAARLLEALGDLRVPYFHERSFRLCRGALLDNRFLVSVGRAALGRKADERILDLCRRVGVPEGLLPDVERHVSATRCVHLGFEGGSGRCLYKVYLELGRQAEGEPAASAPVLLHLAFKWDVLGGDRPVVTRYLWHPSLSLGGIVDRVGRLYGAGELARPCEIVEMVLERAAERMPPEDMQYLEVHEEGNRRRSFDLNVYDAGLMVGDLSPALSAMCRHYAIPAEVFEDLYGTINAETFGHLAGGIHRDGRDFFNVYYGVERRVPRRLAREGSGP